MSNSPPPSAKTPRIPLALVGAGVLVIALGFALPQLTPGTTPAPAAPDSTAKQAAPIPIAPPSAPSLVGSLVKLAVGLAVVCGLCVLLAKWVGPKPPPAPGAMDVAASIAVGPCVLHLVRAGDRRLLIGTDLGGVKAVLELPGAAPEPAPEPPAAEPTAEPAPEPDAEVLTQQKLLNLLLQLRGQPGAPSPP